MLWRVCTAAVVVAVICRRGALGICCSTPCLLPCSRSLLQWVVVGGSRLVAWFGRFPGVDRSRNGWIGQKWASCFYLLSCQMEDFLKTPATVSKCKGILDEILLYKWCLYSGTEWYLLHCLTAKWDLFTKFCWVWKHIVSTIMKPTHSPTQGQPNPRKMRLKVPFGPLFPTANNFSGVGVDCKYSK